MTVTLETIDKVVGLPEVQGPRLTFRLDRVTPREIVAARVRAECERAGRVENIFSLPFEPSERELALNGPRRLKPVEVDVDRQIEVALDAASAGRVIMLFNGTQISGLDEPLAISPFSEATFLRLVPLAGG